MDGVHFVVMASGRLRASSLNLDNANTDRKEEKSKPLVASKTPAEENDGEPGSGEDFHLVGDLERGDVEIGGRDVLEIVLDHVKDSRDAEFPAVG